MAERFEELYWDVENKGAPLRFEEDSAVLRVLQQIRDEAHRFGIIHHRALRGKASIHSQLEDIPGIGPARRKALQKAFGSLKAIKAADIDTLTAVPGMNRTAAEAVRRWAENKG